MAGFRDALARSKAIPRVRDSLRLGALVEDLAWQGLKLVAILALREFVHRVRAGPMSVSVTAPVVTQRGDPFEVAVSVESPFELAEFALYFGGLWRNAALGGPAGGVHRERWLLAGPAPGLRPVVLRVRDSEGHSVTRTRWILVMPRRDEFANFLPGAPEVSV
ncbi:MAG: hypothetical protein ACYDCK_01640 [Thermoplasmatota archaeon]